MALTVPTSTLTDQTVSEFEISDNVYVEKSTGDNEYIYYE